MKVYVQNIMSRGGCLSTLQDPLRVGLSKGMREQLAGIWTGKDGSITLNIFGPYVISSSLPDKFLAWQYLLIKEPVR